MNFPLSFIFVYVHGHTLPQSAYGSKRGTYRHGETRLSIILALGKLGNKDFELEVSLGQGVTSRTPWAF